MNLKKKLLFGICILGLVASTTLLPKAEAASCCESPTATCSSTGTCKACKNCKYCKHCSKNGGSCSICKKK